MWLVQPIITQIDAVGGISANWVLVLITTVAGTLAWTQLREIKQTLREVSKLVQLHDKQIAVLESKHKQEKDDEG